MNIIFKNANQNTMIRFKNFKKNYDDLPVFIQVDMEVIKNTISMQETFEVELTDIESLKKYIDGARIGKAKYFTLQNLEEQFKILFELKNPKSLHLTGFIKDKTYRSEMKFSFHINTLQQNELIDNMQNVIQALT